MKIILASQSPRRKELIKRLGLDAVNIPSKIEEIIDKNLSFEDNAMDLAYQKAMDIFKGHKDDVVLGFDTIVVCGNEIMGKPKDKEEARLYLNKLSGNTHRVITGCAILKKGYSSSFYSSASVHFSKMTEAEIEDYISTDEPYDKAGAYGIQGLASKYIDSIHGDYYAIVGFPISKIYKEIQKFL